MLKLTFTSIDATRAWNRVSISRIVDSRVTEFYSGLKSPNWRTYIQGKWDVLGDYEDTTFDTNSSFYFDMNSPQGFRVKIQNDFHESVSDEKFEAELLRDDWTIRQMISSHLLMYRSACTFPDALEVENQGKCIWQCMLKHKETGRVFGFSEAKGCASVRGTRDGSLTPFFRKLDLDKRKLFMADKSIHDQLSLLYPTELPEKVFESFLFEERDALRGHLHANKVFLSDAVELLDYIVSDQCEHPYDGLVAGCIA